MTSLLSIILEKEQEKSRKGKYIRYAKGRKPIKSLTYGSPLDYELSLLFGSVCHASPKKMKEKKKKIKKQKRVSQTFKVSNSFDNDGIENQRALGACSFMFWLRFVLISWTC